jgi:hypothetical protein
VDALKHRIENASAKESQTRGGYRNVKELNRMEHELHEKLDQINYMKETLTGSAKAKDSRAI